MAKLTLSNLTNLQNEATATSTINANNALISNALENTLSRDGTSPNTLLANLDMNSYRIINLPEPVNNTEPLRLVDVDIATITQMEAIKDATIAAKEAAELAETNAETAETNAETAETNAETAQTAAEVAQTAAEAAQVAAELAETNAETAETNAELAETNAEAAQTAAEVAQAAAELAATNAATAETNAEIAETNAEAAQTAAEAAQVAAEAARDEAEIAADNFGDVYLGSKTSDPTLDNDGNALVEGQLYWNSVSNSLKIYDGAVWQAYSAASGISNVVEDTTPQLGGDLDLNGHVITGMVIGTNIQAYDATILKSADIGTTVQGYDVTTLKSADIGSTVQAYDAQLSSQLRQNSQSAAYTTVLTDGGKQLFHPSSDNNARTFTIAANSSVAYPIGTTISFVNKINTLTISINTDTLTWAGNGSTGNRSLAASGFATAVKIASTEWFIFGVGLT